MIVKRLNRIIPASEYSQAFILQTVFQTSFKKNCDFIKETIVWRKEMNHMKNIETMESKESPDSMDGKESKESRTRKRKERRA